MGHQKYDRIEINDVGAGYLRKLLPDAHIFVDGDCGSVFGEYHGRGTNAFGRVKCPSPHVAILNGDSGMLEVLESQDIGYLALSNPGQEDDMVSFNWRQDSQCLARDVGDTKDYRTALVDESPRNMHETFKDWKGEPWPVPFNTSPAATAAEQVGLPFSGVEQIATGLSPESKEATVNDLGSLFLAIEHMGEALLGIDDTDFWKKTSCYEAEAIADVFHWAGHESIAEDIIDIHGRSGDDDPGDRHHDLYLAEHTPEPVPVAEQYKVTYDVTTSQKVVVLSVSPEQAKKFADEKMRETGFDDYHTANVEKLINGIWTEV